MVSFGKLTLLKRQRRAEIAVTTCSPDVWFLELPVRPVGLYADYDKIDYRFHSLALLKITFSGDNASSKSVTMKTLMTEADFSNKCLGVPGAIMLASFLPKCQYV
jgi:hypothetical protein